MLRIGINIWIIKIIVSLVILIPNAIFATASQFTTPAFESPPVLKMLLGLTAVIGLIFFLAWVSRKMKLVQSSSNGYQIRSLATLPLTTREKICLIEVGGKQILVGIAPGRVNKIHVFEESIDINETTSSDQNENLFSNHFKKALGIPTNEVIDKGNGS